MNKELVVKKEIVIGKAISMREKKGSGLFFWSPSIVYG